MDGYIRSQYSMCYHQLIMYKTELLKQLAGIILTTKKDSPLLVGISGVDGAGKTMFTDDLVKQLKESSRHIIQASIDGFHFPEEIRYKKGENSAEGFYHDSFNYNAAKEVLLEPLSSGSLRYKTAVFDWETNSEVIESEQEAKSDSILVMEGIFLFRPELVNYWDMKIFIDVDFKITMQRGIERSIKNGSSTSREDLEVKYKSRYIPGQQMYFDEANPKQIADIVIDNNDYENPFIV